MDNEKLPAELYKYVGAAIYKGLAYGFEDAVFGGPKPCAAASWDCAVEGVQALASLFADNGFCLKAAMFDVQPGGKGGTFKVREHFATRVGNGRGGNHGLSNLRRLDCMSCGEAERRVDRSEPSAAPSTPRQVLSR